MSYRALYRVFRPQRFDAVIGQSHISMTLKNAMANNRLAHAYLFCGPRGTGKTSSAKILAKAVNCLHPENGEPCNACENCVAINEDRFMDVLEIDAASNRGIDEIRELRDKVRFAPSQGKRKVYIIDEVHMLTNEAFNALLKTLEEPPEHVLFLLATTDPQKIPLTVLSRCQRFDFHKISTEEIRVHLEEIVAEQGATISESALRTISRKAFGGMRDAISILDQCISYAGKDIQAEHVEQVLGSISDDATAQLFSTLLNNNYEQLFLQVQNFSDSGKDVRLILRDLSEYCRQLFLLKVNAKSQLLYLSEGAIALAKQHSGQLSKQQMGILLQHFTEAEQSIRYATQPQIFLESCLIEQMLFLQTPEPSQTMSQQTKPTNSTSATKPATPTIAVQKLIPSNELVQQWSSVMQSIRAVNKKLEAFLKEASPVQLQDNVFVIRFPEKSSFHKNNVCLPENMKILEDTLHTLTGQPIKVDAQLENAQGNIPKELTLAEETAKLFDSKLIEYK